MKQFIHGVCIGAAIVAWLLMFPVIGYGLRAVGMQLLWPVLGDLLGDDLHELVSMASIVGGLLLWLWLSHVVLRCDRLWKEAVK